MITILYSINQLIALHSMLRCIRKFATTAVVPEATIASTKTNKIDKKPVSKEVEAFREQIQLGDTNKALDTFTRMHNNSSAELKSFNSRDFFGFL